MVLSPAKRATAVQYSRVVGGGDSAAGPLTRRTAAVAQVNAQLRAISLEYTHQDLTAATAGWNASRRLGSGCYGAVYRGELKDGTEVAVKVIDLAALIGKGENAEDAGFEEEVQMLSKFRHPNLVTLLGWGQQGLTRYLVYEFLSGGDVFQRLHKSRSHGGDKLFHWHERLSACQDAATGLSHMHNSSPKAFHRDIKSANILLDRHGTAKMADFGLSCVSQQTGALHVTVKTISGTPGYKCPLYERSGRFTEGSEVYSFGMVMLEVVTGLDPSASDPHVPGGISYPVAEIIKPNQAGAIDRVMRHLDFSANWPAPLAKEVATLALRAVSIYDERQRPQFVEVVRSLRSLAERFPPSWAPPQANTPPPAQHAPRGAPPGNAGYPQPQVAKAVTSPLPALQASANHGTAAAAAAAAASAAAAAAAAAALAAAAAGGRTPTKATGTPPPNVLLASSATVAGHASAFDEATATSAACFFLEFVVAQGRGPEVLLPEHRIIGLVPNMATAEGGKLTWSVGRTPQKEHFEAWLPDHSSFSCISRKALEITWTPGSGEFALMACAVNPLSVDNRVLNKGACATLRAGSDIFFLYEQKALLHLRFHPASAAPLVTSCPRASPAVTSASTSTGSGAGSAGGVRAVSGSGHCGSSSVPSASADDGTVPPFAAIVMPASHGQGSIAAASSLPEGVLPAPMRLQETAGGSTPILSMPWSMERAILLEGSPERFSTSGAVLDNVSSVSDAVDGLNNRLLVSPMSGFCIVRSAAKGAYYVLYQHGKGEVAISQLGLENHIALSPSRSRAAIGGRFRLEPTTPTQAKDASAQLSSLMSDSSQPLAAPRSPTRMRPASPCPAMVAAGRATAATTAAPVEQSKRSGWRLQCIHGEGLANEHLLSMPPDMRDLTLVSGTNFIGRHHQPCNFEQWLPEQQTRYCISRTSMQINVGNGGLLVTNMSSNWLYVDSEAVGKGESRSLGHGQVLSFARSEPSTGSLTHFLMLQVRAGDGSETPTVLSPSKKPLSKTTSCSRSPARRRPTTVTPSTSGPAVTPCTRSTAKAVTIPASQFSQVASGQPRSPGGQRPTVAAGVWSPEKAHACGGASPVVIAKSSMEQTVVGGSSPTKKNGASEVTLILNGTGVFDLPAKQRTFAKHLGNGALVVGRRFQSDMHALAVKPEVLEQLGRHEWCIAYEGGTFVLMALSDRVLMWRERRGEFERLSCEKVLPIDHGDRILLGCGGVLSPLDAQLIWSFNCPEQESSPWWCGGAGVVVGAASAAVAGGCTPVR